jgi:hypothetical protein
LLESPIDVEGLRRVVRPKVGSTTNALSGQKGRLEQLVSRLQSTSSRALSARWRTSQQTTAEHAGIAAHKFGRRAAIRRLNKEFAVAVDRLRMA